MRIGIDVGGTKIEAIALDADGQELVRERVPTPSGQYQEILQTIADLVNQLEQKTGQRGTVGVGTPGALSPATGLLRNSNSVVLNHKPLKQDLEALLDRQVRMANDANCFVLSEATDGAATDAHSVFGVIIGTGTGGGIVMHGRLVDGPNAIAGEWGHNPLPWPMDEERPGPVCYCGKHGCIETFLSGPGMEQDYFNNNRVRLDSHTIVQNAEACDLKAEACLQRYEDRMARSLAHVINIIDPHVIVLGGGMSNIRRLYRNVPRLWEKYIFSDKVFTELLPPVHGDSSGVRGAAWLWNDERE